MASGPTEQELISLIIKGEQKHFAVLVERYQSLVFTIAFRYTNNREDAEDLAQMAFVKAYRSLNDYRGDAKFSTWLYTIVSSLCLTFLRKKKLDTHSLDNEKVFAAASHVQSSEWANPVETKSKIQLVNEAISKLSGDDGQMLTLFYKGEQSLEEIGRIMGIDPNTAKVKLHRARGRLKKLMETRFAEAVKDIYDG